MASGILTSHKTADALGNVTPIQRRITVCDTFALDSKISIFVAKLVKKAKNNVDTTKYFWILIAHVQQFKFPANL